MSSSSSSSLLRVIPWRLPMIRNKIGVIGGWTCAIRRKESALQRQIVLSHSALFTAPTTALGDGIASLLMAQQHLMIWLHTPLDGVVLPWWSSIVLGTLVLRTCITLPMAVAQHRSTAHLIQLRPALTAWSNAIAKQVGQEAREKHWTFEHYQKEVKRRYLRKVNQVYWRHRCHPAFGIALIAVQMPLFISMSFMIRRLCGQPIPWIESRLSESIDPEITMQLAQGGLAWFTDLTASDSTWILPTVIGLLHLANIEFGTISARTRQGPELTGWRKNLRSILRGMSFASVPIAAQLPSGVCVYWTTSAAFSLVQNLTMQHPTIRRWCGFPDTSTEK